MRRRLVARELAKASGTSLSSVKRHLFARQTGLSKSVILQLWQRNHPTWNADDCPRSGKPRASDDSDEALFGDARARIQRLINTKRHRCQYCVNVNGGLQTPWECRFLKWTVSREMSWNLAASECTLVKRCFAEREFCGLSNFVKKLFLFCRIKTRNPNC